MATFETLSLQSAALAHWEQHFDPPGDPAFNMAVDKRLADEVCRGLRGPVLRLYGWTERAISLGRRQPVEDLPQSLLNQHLPVVQRPTGGGAVLHELDELTYAVVCPRKILPTPVQLSQIPGFIHRHLHDALIKQASVPQESLKLVEADCPGSTTLCFSAPVCGDLLHHDRKVAGSALRSWREGILIQGSIQGLHLEQSLLASLLSAAVAQAFQVEAGSL